MLSIAEVVFLCFWTVKRRKLLTESCRNSSIDFSRRWEAGQTRRGHPPLLGMSARSACAFACTATRADTPTTGCVLVLFPVYYTAVKSQQSFPELSVNSRNPEPIIHPKTEPFYSLSQGRVSVRAGTAETSIL